MPRGGSCNHPACHDYGEGCRQLTDDELRPREEDIVFAQRLHDEGWFATSSKYRMLAKVPPDWTPEALLRPEVLDTPLGKIAAEDIRRKAEWVGRDHGEQLQLTVRQFKAFKAIEKAKWRKWMEGWRAQEETKKAERLAQEGTAKAKLAAAEERAKVAEGLLSNVMEYQCQAVRAAFPDLCAAIEKHLAAVGRSDQSF